MPLIKCEKEETPQNIYFYMYICMYVDAEIKLESINTKIKAVRAKGGWGNGTVEHQGHILQ